MLQWGYSIDFTIAHVQISSFRIITWSVLGIIPGGCFTKMLSALIVVLNLQNTEHKISLVDYSQCAASAQCNNASQTARNFKHDSKCT